MAAWLPFPSLGRLRRARRPAGALQSSLLCRLARHLGQSSRLFHAFDAANLPSRPGSWRMCPASVRRLPLSRRGRTERAEYLVVFSRSWVGSVRLGRTSRSQRPFLSPETLGFPSPSSARDGRARSTRASSRSFRHRHGRKRPKKSSRRAQFESTRHETPVSQLAFGRVSAISRWPEADFSIRFTPRGGSRGLSLPLSRLRVVLV